MIHPIGADIEKSLGATLRIATASGRSLAGGLRLCKGLRT